jgi:NADH-quinone oxidoreductase subunit M
VSDVRGHELVAVAPLLVLSVLLGLLPRPLLAVVEPAATAVAQLVAR